MEKGTFTVNIFFTLFRKKRRAQPLPPRPSDPTSTPAACLRQLHTWRTRAFASSSAPHTPSDRRLTSTEHRGEAARVGAVVFLLFQSVQMLERSKAPWQSYGSRDEEGAPLIAKRPSLSFSV